LAQNNTVRASDRRCLGRAERDRTPSQLTERDPFRRRNFNCRCALNLLHRTAHTIGGGGFVSMQTTSISPGS
jgi:hypothetical protein